jgi:hypothetical protein
MPHYRIYKLTNEGHINAMPVTADYDEDREAVEHAKDILNGSDLEVWEGKRRVAVLKSESPLKG